jgi:hypothetical protein
MNNTLNMTVTLKPVPMSLYPTMNSLQEVVNLATSRIPVVHQNEMISILMVYQNTLLKQLEK